jgi:hypothetical protein
LAQWIPKKLDDYDQDWTLSIEHPFKRIPSGKINGVFGMMERKIKK